MKTYYLATTVRTIMQLLDLSHSLYFLKFLTMPAGMSDLLSRIRYGQKCCVVDVENKLTVLNSCIIYFNGQKLKYNFLGTTSQNFQLYSNTYMTSLYLIVHEKDNTVCTVQVNEVVCLNLVGGNLRFNTQVTKFLTLPLTLLFLQCSNSPIYLLFSC